MHFGKYILRNTFWKIHFEKYILGNTFWGIHFEKHILRIHCAKLQCTYFEEYILRNATHVFWGIHLRNIFWDILRNTFWEIYFETLWGIHFEKYILRHFEEYISRNIFWDTLRNTFWEIYLENTWCQNATHRALQVGICYLREAKNIWGVTCVLAVENVFQLPALHDANPIIFMTGIRIKQGRINRMLILKRCPLWLYM